jgi:hypothetical protein
MDLVKQPETPQPVMGDEPDEVTQTDDAGEIVNFDRESGEVRFEPKDRQPPRPSRQPSACEKAGFGRPSRCPQCITHEWLGMRRGHLC